jgi:hypothetical protein
MLDMLVCVTDNVLMSSKSKEMLSDTDDEDERPAPMDVS